MKNRSSKALATLTWKYRELKMNAVDNTIKTRKGQHGVYADHADISQELKDAMRRSPRYAYLPTDMRESLEMIQHKVARIINGDPRHVDSWHDIQGYARLVEERLIGDQGG